MRVLSRLQRQAARAPRVNGSLTFARWVTDRWGPSRKARGLRNVDCDLGRLDKHVNPILGQLAIAAVTRSDLERVVARLDDLVRKPKKDGGISWKSASCIWGLVTKAFDDARKAKDRSLRVRADNPAEDVQGPDKGTTKDKTILYPSELLKVWRCKDIPIRWRRMIALAVYTALRSSELRALRWPDVDLEHDLIHVHVQKRKNEGKVSRLKSFGRPHHIHIEPAIKPVLEALKASAIDERVCPMPPLHVMSSRLRRYLLKAGVDREELHVPASDPTRKRISWHDLRGTGLTWWACRGDAPMLIMQRAGHKSMTTTLEYVQLAEAIGAGIGVVFPDPFQGCSKPVPEAVPQPNLPASEASPTRFELCRGTAKNDACSVAWVRLGTGKASG
jgi:integrase